MKLQPDVKKEIRNIAIGTGILSILMLLVFAIIGKFNFSVVMGALLGDAIAILNFLILAFTVQKAAHSKPAKGPMIIQLSYTIRMLMIGIFIFTALKTEAIHSVSAILPLIFPRLTIAMMNFKSLIGGKKNGS